jgi:hypothetical protein
MDSFYRLMNTMKQSHPFPVIRLQELRTWASSGHYQAILDGNYPRREMTEKNPKEDVREGYEYYKSRVDASDDPVMKAAKEAGVKIGKATESVREKLKDVFKKK